MADFDDITIDDETLERLVGTTVVLTGTDDDDEPAFAYERRAAALLAARLGAKVVLFDRSGETWGDSDYEQLLDVDQVEAAGRGHLCAQMRELRDLGAPEVQAWGYALPALESLGRAIEVTEADVVVVPEKLENPSLGERWLLNRDLPARVQEQAGVRPVLVAQSDGRLDLYEGPSSDTGHGTDAGGAPEEGLP
ncbi:MAG: hypothetical protein JJU45_16265 [Acidimicrobiia bacterium]|nr:hypothetical protein [Acidimicrobiia bacterium]